MCKLKTSANHNLPRKKCERVGPANVRKKYHEKRLRSVFAHDATRVPKASRRTIKSIRSRSSIWDSGVVSLPSNARIRTERDGDFVEPEYAT
jgi:hypothetical protein